MSCLPLLFFFCEKQLHLNLFCCFLSSWGERWKHGPLAGAAINGTRGQLLIYTCRGSVSWGLLSDMLLHFWSLHAQTGLPLEKNALILADPFKVTLKLLLCERIRGSSSARHQPCATIPLSAAPSQFPAPTSNPKFAMVSLHQPGKDSQAFCASVLISSASTTAYPLIIPWPVQQLWRNQ